MTQIVIQSFLEVYKVDAEGDVQEYKTIPNAFGGAMYIWMKLAEKHAIPIDWGHPKASFTQLFASISLMERADQWVMAMTFDQFIVPRAHLQTLIRHLSRFFGYGWSTPTLQTLRTTLREALKDEAIQGICFNQNNISCDFWSIRDEPGKEGRPYNIHRDSGHKFLTPEYIQRRSKGED